MTGGKKYMCVFTDEQHEWLVSTAKAANIKGAAVVREALERAMNDRQFKQSLVQAQYKERLQELNDRKVAIAEEERELKRQISGDRVTA